MIIILNLQCHWRWFNVICGNIWIWTWPLRCQQLNVFHFTISLAVGTILIYVGQSYIWPWFHYSRLVTTLQEFCKKWFVPKTWLDELKKLWFYLTDNQGQCVAVEVMKYRSEVGYFGNSPEPRHERSAKVKYRVGQVFLHKSAGYHGVIIGWDTHARVWNFWLFYMLRMEKFVYPHDCDFT